MNQLFPGISAQSHRNAIMQFFGDINARALQRRHTLQQQQLLPGPVLDLDSAIQIGAQTIRQLVHAVCNDIGPPEFTRNFRAALDMVGSLPSDMTSQVFSSDAVRTAFGAVVMPSVQATALHSSKTADQHYGLSGNRSLLQRGGDDARAFMRTVIDQEADKAYQAMGTDRQAALQQQAPSLQPLPAAFFRPPPGDPQPVLSGSSDDDLGLRLHRLLSQPANSPWPTDTFGQCCMRAAMTVDGCAGDLLGRGFCYAPGQRELVVAAAMQLNVFGCLPTGAGKTLAVAASMLAHRSDVHILLLPLLALEAQIIKRLTDEVCKGEEGHVVPFSQSDTRLQERHIGSVSLLVISASDIASTQFQRFKGQLQEHGRTLGTVFVDEAHWLVQGLFRPEYQRVPEIIRGLGRPIVCMTATAGPRLRDAILYGLLELHRGQVAIIERSAQRLNIAYRVVHARAQAEEALVAEFTELLWREMDDPGKPWAKGQVMVFGPSKKMCDVLAAALAPLAGAPVDVYDGETGPADRLCAAARFQRREVRIIVGTQAMGCGLDLHGVTIVAHFALPSANAEGYLQETGRAARSRSPGSSGLALLFYSKRMADARKVLLQQKATVAAAAPPARHTRNSLCLDPELKEFEAMDLYCQLSAPSCRRIHLGAALGEPDPQLQSCRKLCGIGTSHVAPCDLCCAVPEAAMRAASTAIEIGRGRAEAYSLLSRDLEAAQQLFGKYCMRCALFCGMAVEGAAHSPLEPKRRCLYYRCSLCSGPHLRIDCTVIDKRTKKDYRCLGCMREACPNENVAACLKGIPLLCSAAIACTQSADPAWGMHADLQVLIGTAADSAITKLIPLRQFIRDQLGDTLATSADVLLAEVKRRNVMGRPDAAQPRAVEESAKLSAALLAPRGPTGSLCLGQLIVIAVYRALELAKAKKATPPALRE